MEEAEDLQPIEHGERRLQYLVVFNVQTVQEEPHGGDRDLHDDHAELHQQPRRVQYRIFLRERESLRSEREGSLK